jgi:hypothetical protein
MSFTYTPHLAFLKIIGIVASTLILYGCFDKEAFLVRYKAENELVAATNIGLPPNNIEQLIKKWGDDNLKDPNSAEYSHIQPPKKSIYPSLGDGHQKQKVVYRTYACINAKNSYGGYGGKELYVFYIEQGHIIYASELGASQSCTGAQ